MTTAAQVEANQRNAQKSTGPRTEEGKEQSRANALKHGMSSNGPVADASRRELAEDRKHKFRRELDPQGAFKTYLVDQIAESSVLTEICGANLNAALAREASRALDCWDDDRRLDAAILADKLPKKPEVVILKLKRTRHGCEYLIARWIILAGFLERETAWTPELKSQALDMLGVEHLHRSGPTQLDPIDGLDVNCHLKELVTTQVTQLRAKVTDFLASADEDDQKSAIAGTNAFLSRDVQLILRYRMASCREVSRLLKEFYRKPKPGSQIDHERIDDMRADETSVRPVIAPDEEVEGDPRFFADGRPNVDYLQLGERLEGMSVARFHWLQETGQISMDLELPAVRISEIGEIRVRETNPISDCETNPISASDLARESTRPGGNRRARRRRARELATAGR